MPSFLSVIVCTYNREKYIGRCLKQLAEQQADANTYEVIVVNNNSTDQTEKICTTIVEQHPHFHYFLETNQGHSHSRNRGIHESSGDLISFLDDDAFVSADYVTNILAFFGRNLEVQAIGGKINPLYEGVKPQWMSSYLLPLVAAQDLGENEKPFRGRKFPIGANMAFRKSVFTKYGEFNVNLGRKGVGLEGGDEKEVFLRLKAARVPIYYVPNVQVDHIIPDKRVTKDYIRGLAMGVGTSERRRIQESGGMEIVRKIGEEVIKSMGTFVLFLIYS
jgi:glycosyltransferase involved in cell wall biosynthesis